MSKSNTFENDFLSLVLQSISISSLAVASTGVNAIWASLHTADPTDAGTQGSGEANYGSYTRIAVTRSTAGFVVSSGSASPVAAITFPEAASTTTMTLTHAAFGETSASTGGKIYWSGTLTPNVNIGSGVTPRITTGSSVQED
jgi:hypothetical protein